MAEEFVPVENILKMRYLEQYAQAVRVVSSKYNGQNTHSYSPINLVGKYEKYPAYGDFPEVYFLRSYGKWWKDSGASQKEYRPQDFDLLGAEDFVILEYATAVIPREIFIYEVYNPGAIIRIWATLRSEPLADWILLWEGFPQKCAPRSRKFSAPLRKVNSFISVLRIEFNQHHLEYHTAIDAVLLSGYQVESDLKYQLITKGLAPLKRVKRALTVKDLEDNLFNKRGESFGYDYFSLLPNEIILKIFQYLDLKSLSRCAQVNQRWYKLSRDKTHYQNVSLKTYWNLVDSATLEYFSNKAWAIRKLDLSWCDSKTVCRCKMTTSDKYFQGLEHIIESASKTLTHLCLNDNLYVGDTLLIKVALCAQLTELRLRSCNIWNVIYLDCLTKLVTLDLSLSSVTDKGLISVLTSNPHLEHLVIDICDSLTQMDHIADTVAKYNKKLKTWSSWKTTVGFTPDGVKKLSLCQHLEELDLGWCLMHHFPGEILGHIARECKKLRRLIISEWRAASDQMILPIILSCKEITQLDFLGIKNITEELCGKALFLLPKLRLLDISFCDGIRQDEVEIWRQQYPHITIQRSCQFTSTNYL